MEKKNIFIRHFSKISDSRIERTKHHKLLDILAIAICAVLSGADYWTDIEAYAQEKKAWLKTFLELPHGIPSHDTIARVFSRLDPAQFQQAFLSWIRTLMRELSGEIVAIDGKTLKGSHERCQGKKALTLSVHGQQNNT